MLWLHTEFKVNMDSIFKKKKNTEIKTKQLNTAIQTKVKKKKYHHNLHQSKMQASVLHQAPTGNQGWTQKYV